MWNRFHRTRIEGAARLWVVGVLAVLELAFVSYLWARAKPQAQVGFLMKVGPRYVLAWKTENSEFDTSVHSELQDAVAYAQGELGLRRGRNYLESGDVEYLNLSDRPSGFVVHWKTFEQARLNQLTFHDREEAQYFWESIRTGSYSPSPFGHSLLFFPKEN